MMHSGFHVRRVGGPGITRAREDERPTQFAAESEGVRVNPHP